MGLIKEFKEFAVKGNMMDLAVGVIIGAAFGKIITSLVEDIIMPPIGYLLSGLDFANKKVLLRAADEENKLAEVAIRYGNFINILIQFLIIAVCIFLVVKFINRMRRKEQEEPSVVPAPTREEALLTEIRDALTGQRKE